MAIRQKTIEYAWPTDAFSIIGNQSAFTSSTIVVSIPETGSRSFKSVWVEHSARDSQSASTGRAIPALWLSDYNLGGYAAQTRKLNRNNGGPADSGEHYLWSFVEDLTSFFSSSFTGSAHSMSYTFWNSGSGGTNYPLFTNITNKLFITYEYDDSASRKIKTVAIPLDYTGSIKNIMLPIPNSQNMGQIPALDTFCPESNKSFKQIWINFIGTDKHNTAGTALTNVSASIDNGTRVRIGNYAQSLASLTTTNAVMDISTIDTSTTHSLWMGLSATGTTDFQNVMPVLYATYEYDSLTSNRILNSVQLPFTHPGYSQYVDSITDSVNYLDFYIPESNVQIKQSGVHHYISSTSTGVIFSYVCNPSSSAVIGGYKNTLNGTFQHAINGMRIDPSGSFYPLTASVNLNTGYNRLRSVVCIAASAHRTQPPNSVYFINYESDKNSNGEDSHNKTVKRLQFSGSIWLNVNYRTVTGSIESNVIPESDYYINGYGYYHSRFGAPTGQRIFYANVPLPTYMDFYSSSVDGQAFDSKNEDSLYSYAFASEVGYLCGYQCDQSGLFQRYPSQSVDYTNNQGVLNPFLTRAFYVMYPTNRIAMWDCITYHSQMFSLTGSITGYSGDGSGVAVGLHDSVTGRLLKSTVTSTGGTYTMSWHDRSREVYTEAYQDSTHTGRSVNSTL